MAHEMFKLPNASEEMLSTILLWGGLSSLCVLALAWFFIWRGKNRGLGKPRQRGSRTRKPKRR